MFEPFNLLSPFYFRTPSAFVGETLLKKAIGLKGFKLETEHNIVQFIFTEIQKFLQNSLWKS